MHLLDFPPQMDPQIAYMKGNILIILFQGVFFIIPCVDIYEKIDMRTQTFDVRPQEVMMMLVNEQWS